jgi:uncharacterized repeat protein (TIGR01451 family)
VTYMLTITAPGSGSFVNTASSTAGTPDPVPANNNGTAPASQITTTVTPAADVLVRLIGPTNASVGDPITFTLTVTNRGPGAAANVLVSNALPTNVVFVGSTGGGLLTNGGGSIVWPAARRT